MCTLIAVQSLEFFAINVDLLIKMKSVWLYLLPVYISKFSKVPIKAEVGISVSPLEGQYAHK